MMKKLMLLRSRMGLGPLSMKSTVWSSTFFTSATPATYTAMVPLGCLMRLYEKTTSSAVNGLPSWNLTPLRSSKRTCVGLMVVHLVASAGSTSYLGP